MSEREGSRRDWDDDLADTPRARDERLPNWKPGSGIATAKKKRMPGTEELRKVSPQQRVSWSHSVVLNRRWAEAHAQRQRERHGPSGCENCGAPPCGHLWTAPGRPEPRGDRCCDKCTHDSVAGWQHTHTAWTEGQHFPVNAMLMREGEVVYLRRDGMVMFLELRAHSSEQDQETPRVIFLGRGAEDAALFPADDGGSEVNSWEGAQELDPLWLPGRSLMAEQADSVRRARLKAEQDARQAAEAEVERQDAEKKVAEVEKTKAAQEVVLKEVQRGRKEARELGAAAGGGGDERGEPPRVPRTSQRKRGIDDRKARARVVRLARAAGRHRVSRET